MTGIISVGCVGPYDGPARSNRVLGGVEISPPGRSFCHPGASASMLISASGIVCDGRTEEILRNRELLEANGLELPLCMQAYGR